MPALLESRVEGYMLYKNSSEKVLLEFRGGRQGVLPEVVTLDLGLEKQGELEHTKVEKRIFLNVLEESESKGSSEK